MELWERLSQCLIFLGCQIKREPGSLNTHKDPRQLAKYCLWQFLKALSKVLRLGPWSATFLPHCLLRTVLICILWITIFGSVYLYSPNLRRSTFRGEKKSFESSAGRGRTPRQICAEGKYFNPGGLKTDILQVRGTTEVPTSIILRPVLR